MKKLNFKGKFDLNKQTVTRLNEEDQKQVKGGKTKTFDSAMTVRDTLTCHCDYDSAMTVMDTYTCHCDTKEKTCH